MSTNSLMKKFLAVILVFAVVLSLNTPITYAASKTVQDLVNEALPLTEGMTEEERIEFINNYIDEHFDQHDGKTEEEIKKELKEEKIELINNYIEKYLSDSAENQKLIQEAIAFAYVRSIEQPDGSSVYFINKGKGGFFSDPKALLLDSYILEPIYTYISEPDKNAIVCVQDKSGFWHLFSLVTKEFIYHFYKDQTPLEDSFSFIDEYRYILAVNESTQKRGFINSSTYETAIPFNYEYLEPFSEGLAVSQLNGKFGYIDNTGKTIIEHKYMRTFSFKDGIGAVSVREGVVGAIDKTDNIIVPLEYNVIVSCGGGLIAVGVGEQTLLGVDVKKWGFYNDIGERLSDLIYDELISYGNGKAIVEKDGIRYTITYITTNPETTTTKEEITAIPTTSKVMVNGKPISFNAYLINGNNYFKLRDLATVISGSDKQFEVSWDNTKNAINLISAKSYTAVGGELAEGDGKAKTATKSTSTIYKDGIKVVLKAYTINGNNYFMLRDVGKVFDFGVTWDGITSTIEILTSTGYMDP